MLDESDIAAIRAILREESRAQRRREKTRERVRKYRERLLAESCNAAQNECNAALEGNVTLSENNVTLSEGRNGHSQSSLPFPLLSPPHTPPLNLPNPNKINAHAHARGPCMSNAALETLSLDPLYAGIDLAEEAIKFERWCKANNKLNTVRRFVNWINKK